MDSKNIERTIIAIRVPKKTEFGADIGDKWVKELV
jgi:hypothetical protein